MTCLMKVDMFNVAMQANSAGKGTLMKVAMLNVVMQANSAGKCTLVLHGVVYRIEKINTPLARAPGQSKGFNWVLRQLCVPATAASHAALMAYCDTAAACLEMLKRELAPPCLGRLAKLPPPAATLRIGVSVAHHRLLSSLSSDVSSI